MGKIKICLILLTLGIAFVSCGKKQISIPKEFGIDKEIYLGQNISKLKKERDLKPIDSAIGYQESLERNKYF